MDVVSSIVNRALPPPLGEISLPVSSEQLSCSFLCAIDRSLSSKSSLTRGWFSPFPRILRRLSVDLIKVSIVVEFLSFTKP